MGYDARWNSTDQIPQRLIDAGTFNGQPFGRFDSLDPTDGGRHLAQQPVGRMASQRRRPARTKVGLRDALPAQAVLQLHLRARRPADGDQFSQQDNRNVYGLRASHALRATRWAA